MRSLEIASVVLVLSHGADAIAEHHRAKAIHLVSAEGPRAAMATARAILGRAKRDERTRGIATQGTASSALDPQSPSKLREYARHILGVAKRAR